MAEQSIQLTKLASCAGCGAKVGAGVLAQLLGGLKVHSDPRLLVGFDKSDDASVYQVTDELALVQTVDFFPPIADDPYLFGQIAATNALSDVYAMGGEPKLALNLLCIPESMPKEAVHQLLRGGYDKAYEAGVIITGGHSILDPEPKYGLAVTGFVHPDRILKNVGAQPGDVLLCCFGSSVPNHAAIYCGDGELLHHIPEQLSKRERYTDKWQRRTHSLWRHRAWRASAFTGIYNDLAAASTFV